MSRWQGYNLTLGGCVGGLLYFYYNEEGILYANLDLAKVAQSKLNFGVVGHYARPNVFQLIMHEAPMLLVTHS